LTEAVVREVREETGLLVTCGPALGWVERIGEEHHFVIVDFRAEPVDPAAPPVPGDDAAAVAWVPLDELTTVDLVPGLVEFLADHGIIAPGQGG
jgi:8-oxo-dGTP diphosphatase